MLTDVESSCFGSFSIPPPTLPRSRASTRHSFSSTGVPTLFLHGNNLNSLHQLIHPEILPSEFGGMLPPYDMGTWARTLLDHEYDDDSEYNVDSYSMPVREVEKELSPKSMKR